MSTQHIYMSGSTRVHKHLRRPCMPEYGSESWTLCLCVCICICEACERYLSMELSVMKIIGVDFIVVWIFCSFNDIFISSYTFKMFWKLIGLLSNYHNNCHHTRALCLCLHRDAKSQKRWDALHAMWARCLPWLEGSLCWKMESREGADECEARR